MEDKFQWYKPGFLPALFFLIGSAVLSFSLPAGEGESADMFHLLIITHTVFFAMFFLMDEGLLGLGRWNFAAPFRWKVNHCRYCPRRWQNPPGFTGNMSGQNGWTAFWR